MPSTSPPTHTLIQMLFLANFVMSICVDRNSIDNVCGLLSTLRTEEIIIWEFQKNRMFNFHFADDPNIAPHTPLHAKCCFWRSSSCLSVLIEIVVTTCVGSNRLYALRRSFSQNFRNAAFLIFTLQTTPTWPCWWCNITAQRMAILGSSAKWKSKLQYFWYSQRMISRVSRVDLSPQTLSQLLCSTHTATMNIARNSNMYVQKLVEPYWGHQQIEKEKCDFFETLTKSFHDYVESIRAHKCAENYFLQYRQTPRISIFWLFSILLCWPRKSGFFKVVSHDFKKLLVATQCHKRVISDV